MESLKYSVRRSLSTLSVGFRGKYSNVRHFCVDVPLSPNTFCRLFADEYRDEENFKKMLTVEQLSAVLGLNWHLFQFQQSNTRKRVIGDVQLHFRKKTVPGPKVLTDHRYKFTFLL